MARRNNRKRVGRQPVRAAGPSFKRARKTGPHCHVARSRWRQRLLTVRLGGSCCVL